ncbi:MAG: hypothetical protein KatS3mg033_2022 [Thermonema sp.]|uniref:hypothetical protein n=1 Tax=Thermonema sp. TaxID=2231181 RepID=UPI0021DE50CA|nr:hypothetical protein [Thermonema sp.]GIV40222.1 MAG: hypothetical protein KatS3mg033_2022 [Thermonema sp.]
MEENIQMLEAELLKVVEKLKKGIAKIEQASQAYEEAKTLIEDTPLIKERLNVLEKRLETLQSIEHTTSRENDQTIACEQTAQLEKLSQELDQAITAQHQLIVQYEQVAKQLSQNMGAEIEDLKQNIDLLSEQLTQSNNFAQAFYSKTAQANQNIQEKIKYLMAKEVELSNQITRLKMFLVISVVASSVAMLIAIFF